MNGFEFRTNNINKKQKQNDRVEQLVLHFAYRRNDNKNNSRTHAYFTKRV